MCRVKILKLNVPNETFSRIAFDKESVVECIDLMPEKVYTIYDDNQCAAMGTIEKLSVENNWLIGDVKITDHDMSNLKYIKDYTLFPMFAGDLGRGHCYVEHFTYFYIILVEEE